MNNIINYSETKDNSYFNKPTDYRVMKIYKNQRLCSINICQFELLNIFLNCLNLSLGGCNGAKTMFLYFKILCSTLYLGRDYYDQLFWYRICPKAESICHLVYSLNSLNSNLQDLLWFGDNPFLLINYIKHKPKLSIFYQSSVSPMKLSLLIGCTIIISRYILFPQ